MITGSGFTGGPERVATGAVHRGARRVDEPLDAVVVGRLEQALGREHVPLDVPLEVLSPGVRDTGLAGQVGDEVDAVQRFVEWCGAQVADDQLEARIGGQGLEILSLALRIVELGEGVETADGVTPAEQ